MTEFIEISWTTGSIDEARKVCRYLVQEKWVACAQIIPWVESIYSWNGQLETTQESKVCLKTISKNFEEIKKIIIKNSSYQVPEILYHVIDGGDNNYLNWMESSCMDQSYPNGKK